MTQPAKVGRNMHKKCSRCREAYKFERVCTKTVGTYSKYDNWPCESRTAETERSPPTGHLIHITRPLSQLTVFVITVARYPLGCMWPSTQSYMGRPCEPCHTSLSDLYGFSTEPWIYSQLHKPQITLDRDSIFYPL